MSATPQQPPIGRIEQKGIADLLAKGRRIDERKLTDYRDLKIQTGLIQKANGSAMVDLGKTKVMTGIKVELGEPFPDTPNQGVLTVNAEFVPFASPAFEPGPPSEGAIELARVVDRGIRESKAIGLEELCVKPKKHVVVVFVDVYVLDHDGNLIDAASISALAALLTSKTKRYEMDGEEVRTSDELVPLPVRNEPVAITTAKIDGNMILDPCLEEELIMRSRLTVTTDRDGNICAMQKGGNGIFTDQEIRQAVKTAIEKGREIRETIRGATAER
jgi:exosome complex component RRP42